MVGVIPEPPLVTLTVRGQLSSLAFSPFNVLKVEENKLRKKTSTANVTKQSFGDFSCSCL